MLRLIGAQFSTELAKQRPQAITTLSPALAARIAALIEGMDIDPNDAIDGEVDL
jgi:antitoxin PrlF